MVLAYLKFLWQSTNEHGVHSPFVFKLVTECFYKNKRHYEFRTLRQFRQSILKNKKTITITDFGAGSKVFKSNSRPVNQIAKTSGITQKRAELLFKVVKYFKPKNVLEIGTSLGLATAALSLGNPKSKIITVEGCPETARIAQNNFYKFGFQNIELIISKFEYFLGIRQKALGNSQISYSNRQSAVGSELSAGGNNEKPNTQNPIPKAQSPKPKAKYDFIFFDGNHSYEATLLYFESLLDTATNDSVWIFDDIHWSKDMEKAWETIKNHPKVTVTIDTFYWGLVFFRTEQKKEHFTIRI